MTPLQPVNFGRGRDHEPRLSEPYVPGRTHKRFWTNEERQIVRDHFPKGGAAACLVHLGDHRTPSGVYGLAKKLGLKSEKMSDAPKSRYRASPELDAAITAAWAELDGKKKGEVAALADRLGVPRWWLTKRAIRLGLAMPHKKEPVWTAAENELMRRVPLHDPDKCAKIFREHGFRRSPTAIVVRAKRLDLSRRATRLTLSATRVAKILGVDGKTVTRWILAGELVAEKRADRRLAQQGGSAWDVTKADLRHFVVDRLEWIDLRKVEKFAFVDLLVEIPAAATRPEKCKEAANRAEASK